MEYLAEENFIHRDLAARNCMLDSDLIIKVADFGLTRDIYQKNYYTIEDKSQCLPISWMSLESIQESKFTTYSDVWSYGVLLWEMFTFGAEPYQGFENIEIPAYLRSGRRLHKPLMAPDMIYDMMINCWNIVPVKRPLFKDILSMLERYADVRGDYMDVVKTIADCSEQKEPSNEEENGNKIIDMDTDEQMMSATNNSVN